MAAWQLYGPRLVRFSGDPTLESFQPLESLTILRTVQTRELDRFDLADDHAIQFLILDDDQRSIAILETGGSNSRRLTGVTELAGASPSVVWQALNAEGRDPPRELLDLYGPPDGQRTAGWLVERWLAEPPASFSGPCDNGWFQTAVGTAAAFPDAEEHFLRLDRWGDSSGQHGGYYQYAGYVEVWHGGICLQQEIKVDDFAAPGTAWYLWYARRDEYSLSLVTPAFAPRPGQWGHWIWYKCHSCDDRLWMQVAAPNPGLLIQFDMGMDWTF